MTAIYVDDPAETPLRGDGMDRMGGPRDGVPPWRVRIFGAQCSVELGQHSARNSSSFKR